MKKVLKNAITLIGEASALILSVIWYYNTGEIEPIIIGIAALAGIIVGLLLIEKNKNPFIEIIYQYDGKTKSATQPSNLTPKGENGNYQITIGNFIGKREFSWRYKLCLVNTTNQTAFKPILYVRKEFSNLNFFGPLSQTEPINERDSIELKMEISKWYNGSPEELNMQFEAKYPDIMIEQFEVILEYSNENSKKFYSKSYFASGEWKTKKIKKIPNNFNKAKVYYK